MKSQSVSPSSLKRPVGREAAGTFTSLSTGEFHCLNLLLSLLSKYESHVRSIFNKAI
jgi:hypothetical protein